MNRMTKNRIIKKGDVVYVQTKVLFFWITSRAFSSFYFHKKLMKYGENELKELFNVSIMP